MSCRLPTSDENSLDSILKSEVVDDHSFHNVSAKVWETAVPTHVDRNWIFQLPFDVSFIVKSLPSRAHTRQWAISRCHHVAVLDA